MILNKITIPALIIGVLISNVGIVSAKNDTFNPLNTNAYQEYLNLKEQSQESNIALANSESEFDRVVLNENVESVKLFESNNGNEAQISYNVGTNQYIYTETQDDSNTLLMIVEDEKYQIINKGENVYLVSENGEEKIISEMIYEDNEAIKDYSDIVELPETKENISVCAYGKNYGPFYKTNKSWCVVLSIISKATKLFKWAHPALGTISFISNAVSKAGDKLLKTMYIKYYQAFDTVKPSNVKETQHWYFDKNHKDFAKTKVLKFSSVRPS